jgi:ribosome-binding protein aMBF1 (putative translation factor)
MVNARCGICGRWYRIENMVKYKGKTGECFMCRNCYEKRKQKEKKSNKDAFLPLDDRSY